MATISAALAIAVQHHQAGQIQAAEQIYRQILAVDLNHAHALHLLGIIASQTGKHEFAVQYISRAIELNGTESGFHGNLGNAFKAQGKLDKAIASYRRALELKPDYAVAHYNLGIAFLDQGTLDEAVTCFRRAVELKPDYAVAHNNLGNAFQAQGKLNEAVACYRRALELKPDHAEAQSNLGTAVQALRKSDEAVTSYRRALELKPDDAETYSNLGAALNDQGKLDEAVACLRRALELKPDYAVAHYNLGNALQAQGKLDEAAVSYRRALKLKPDFPEAHNNLGNALQAGGRLDKAATSYLRALELKPNFAEAHRNLGAAFRARGNLNEANDSFHRALELKPDYAEAYNDLGNTFQDQGKLDEAVARFRGALKLKPDYAEAHNNLGNALKDQGQLDEAVACYRRALELKPDLHGAHNNLGIAFQAQRRPDEAVACFRRALELKPDFAEAHSNLGNALRDRARLDEAMTSYRRAIEMKVDFIAAHSNLLYTLWFCPSFDSATIYEEHCLWNRQHAEPLAKFIEPHTNDANPSRRLHVGYVSPNFRLHAEAFFLAPLFSAHDHQQFEIFCYSDVVLPDETTAKLRACSDVWRVSTGLSDEKVAQLVRKDQIDILVDLTMHMAHGRPLLFARKPAPVQVCWLAYQGTTGLSTVDYRLTDPILDPPGLFDRYYSEESVRLPDSFWCYDPLASEPAVNSSPVLEKGYVTFGSLNNFCKVNEEVLRLWARVLRAVDRSKLMILAGEGSHRQRTLEFLAEEGIAPERIIFQGFVPRPDYLRLYHQIDIGLDTFPYNGQTTTLDAVWMGVPVVTIIGQTATGRAGASLLRNLGTPELVADSPDQFVSIAVELANDARRLSTLRASLRERLEKSPLMDGPRFAGNVEAAYRSMWQRWCAARGRSTSA
jgi:predicted O-linked N-acetylglucosamine transferase (SPINDLY family)